MTNRLLNSFAQNQARRLIVVDVTEASENMREALLFAGYPDRCLIRVGREFVSLPLSMDIYINVPEQSTMSTKRFKLTLNKLPKGAKVVPGKTVAQFNKRVSEAMKNVDRDFQRKQRASADKANKIVLNA